MPYKPYLLILCALAIMSGSCKKKNGPGGTVVPPPVPEAELVVSVPTMKITSTPVPTDGVNVVVTVLDPAGNPIPQSAAVISGDTITITLIGLPSLKVADVTITVTSKAKPTNTKTYKFGVMNKTP
jgi:endonuclease YncB( thermonuclease family)